MYLILSLFFSLQNFGHVPKEAAGQYGDHRYVPRLARFWLLVCLGLTSFYCIVI